jgi:Uncharacterised nucleotidyltransferase
MAKESGPDRVLEAIERSLKKAVAAFERARIPYLLGGGLAVWARGGSQSYNDLDFMVKPEDAERALEALVAAGMRPERPAEQWLLKAWDGDLLIDVIHHPQGLEMTDEVIRRGEAITIFGVVVSVMALEDVFTTKLLAIGEHELDYERVLQMARSLREQVDWDEVRRRTESSPYARAFFTLAEGLEVIPGGREAPADRPHKRRMRAV